MMKRRACITLLPVVMGPCVHRDDGWIKARIPAARCARVVLEFMPPKNQRGRREGRVLAGTRGLVCNSANKNAHEHTGISRGIRPSLRNGLTAYAALSPETNSSCLRRRRIGG